MKILAYVSKDSSPAYHRIILPLEYIDIDEVQVRNNLDTEHFEGISLFIYNRILPQFAIEVVNALRNRHGFKICVDVDDYWNLDDTHPYKNEYKEKDFARLQISQLENADFVTVTNERLANAVKPYNKHVHILPNAIPQAGQFISVLPNNNPDKTVRLFWQGSSSHLADIAEIRGVTARLEESSMKRMVEMVLAGYEKDQLIWQEMANLYTDRGKLKHSLLSPLHYEHYYFLYQEADICLAPLRKSLFNGMKSNLKVLEAANLKLPIIVSKVNPYLNMPVLYASNNNDWMKQIIDLVINRDKRIEAGEKIHEYCKEHFNFSKINTERKQLYQFYNLK